MTNADRILAAEAPRTLSEAVANWPVRERYHPSPADWRDQVFYFLLPDRFSDGSETAANILRAELRTAEGIAKDQSRAGRFLELERLV